MHVCQPLSARQRGTSIEPGAVATRESTAKPLAFDVRLLVVCRRSGGLARADEIIRRLGQPTFEADWQVNDWGAERKVCYLVWGGRVWMPLFKFERTVFAPLPQMAGVIAEWAGELDGFELCLWFVTPNAWLGGATPAETLTDLEQVRNAARADRFVRWG